jgi:CRP-like cAMP-binding protein
MPFNNRLLDSLSEDQIKLLKPHLKDVELRHADVLAKPREHITHVYFPTAGIISLVIELNDGDMIETGMIGNDGALGGGAALDGSLMLNKAIVQVPGQGITAHVDAVKAVAEKVGPFRSLLTRHEQVLHAQSQQSAACNASHTVEARMCRWLLRMRDLAGDELPLTQEFLGQMMGVRRTSVSLVANTLQQAGLISYRRGKIKILNVEAIQESACECYEAVRAHYELMLKDPL